MISGLQVAVITDHTKNHHGDENFVAITTGASEGSLRIQRSYLEFTCDLAPEKNFIIPQI